MEIDKTGKKIIKHTNHKQYKHKQD